MKHPLPLCAAALAAALSTLPLHAAEPGPAPQKRGELFNQFKALESDSHQARMRILQEAEACIQAATTPQSYRACEQQEQAARQAYRDAHQPERQALREQMRQLRQEHLRAAPGQAAGTGE